MTKRNLPAPFYAVAGAGDLAYQRLRKLPDTAERTLRAAGETATSLRERVANGESREYRDRISGDLAKLRESAQRGATVVVSSAAVAQQKAVTGYRTLVAHGERVVAARTRGSEAATAEIVAAAAAEPVVAEPEPEAAPKRTSPEGGVADSRAGGVGA